MCAFNSRCFLWPFFWSDSKSIKLNLTPNWINTYATEKTQIVWKQQQIANNHAIDENRCKWVVSVVTYDTDYEVCCVDLIFFYYHTNISCCWVFVWHFGFSFLFSIYLFLINLFFSLQYFLLPSVWIAHVFCLYYLFNYCYCWLIYILECKINYNLCFFYTIKNR